MATQKRASRTAAKKPAKSSRATSQRSAMKVTSERRKRAPASASTSITSRGRKKAGVIKRAIKKGIAELTKVGT